MSGMVRVETALDPKSIEFRDVVFSKLETEIRRSRENAWEEKTFDIGDILTIRYVRVTPLTRPISQVFLQAAVLNLDLGAFSRKGGGSCK